MSCRVVVLKRATHGNWPCCFSLLSVCPLRVAGTFPETVAVNLWGLDAIKSKVRSFGYCIYFAKTLNKETSLPLCTYTQSLTHTHLSLQGESVAMVLHFVGGRPVKEGTGRIARFELIPLQAS